LATITGGHYYRASSTDKEIDEIADILNGFDKKEFSTKVYQRLEERYQIFAFIAFFLFLLEFFIGEKPGQWNRVRTKPISFTNMTAVLKSIIAVILLFSGLTAAHADVKKHVREGNRLFQKKDPIGARGEFESAQIDAPEAAFIPYNIGITYYAEGKFDEAKRSFETALAMATDPDLKSKAAYNLGHLNFSMGDRAGAIDKFKEALKYNHRDIDAKYNIEYIKSGKTPKNPPQKQQNDNSQQSKEGENKEDSKPEEKKQGDLSKEDAERVLNMVQDQEKEKMKQERSSLPKGKSSKETKNDETNEDW
jgi:tetratricopeptide (TPR) repeat protein